MGDTADRSWNSCDLGEHIAREAAEMALKAMAEGFLTRLVTIKPDISPADACLALGLDDLGLAAAEWFISEGRVDARMRSGAKNSSPTSMLLHLGFQLGTAWGVSHGAAKAPSSQNDTPSPSFKASILAQLSEIREGATDGIGRVHARESFDMADHIWEDVEFNKFINAGFDRLHDLGDTYEGRAKLALVLMRMGYKARG